MRKYILKLAEIGVLIYYLALISIKLTQKCFLYILGVQYMDSETLLILLKANVNDLFIPVLAMH